MTGSQKNTLILLLVVLMGAYLRFYKLDWGEGHFFHPDEYHVVQAVNQILPPHNLNPHLFSYGSSIVYLTYILKNSFNIPNAFIAGRIISALFSTISIYSVFLISKKIMHIKWALIACLLTALNPGLIQQAHFATPESTLIAFLLFCVLCLTHYIETSKVNYFFLACCALGFATATKISALTLLPIVFFTPLPLSVNKIHSSRSAIIAIIYGLPIFGISHFLAFPYSILDWANFKRTTIYESGLGMGKQLIFYTEQFVNSKPILFQLTKIYPYTLGITALAFGISGIIVSMIHLARKPKHNPSLLIIFLSFVFLFISNALLFAKWTRFMAPSLPFFAIFAGYVLSKVKHQMVANIFMGILIIPTILWTTAFFSIYQRGDVRIQADMWIKANISPEARILTESRNMVEVPFGGSKKPFEFYDLETNPLLKQQLIAELETADYFIIQSRRLFANFQNQKFPTINNFYTNLFNGNLGFEEIKRFDSYPKLVIGHKSFVIPDERSEETWSVFDHPVIRIYKKVRPLSEYEYQKLLTI